MSFKNNKENNNSLSNLNVIEANKLDNPIAMIPEYINFESNGDTFNFETKRASDLDQSTKEYLFKLLENNMKTLYENSKKGWNKRSKYNEMFEYSAYYFIANSAKLNKIVAFSHFRFDMDFDDQVLYCYELQIENDSRRNGLGQYMMKLLELLALKTGMNKVMLTCFKHNYIGQTFFKNKMRYKLDETDMNDDITLCLDYEILSKKIPKLK